MHADPHRSGGGADDLADLVVGEAGAVSQGEEVLLLRLKSTHDRSEPLGPLESEQPFFRTGIRVGDECGSIRERLRRTLALSIEHRVARDLEQPTGEAPLPAKATDLCERRGEDLACHVSQVAPSRIRTRA